MTSSDANALTSAVKWADEGLTLQEFLLKNPLPQIAKIIKGQYKNLGVPTLPSPSLNQTIFLSFAGKRVKVVAQCVKFKEGRRVVPVGPILAIPEKFNGWFEILSEDGRAMRCIETVAELVKRFPDTCIVRENIKAYVMNTDSGKITDKTRVIHSGETLVLVSEISGSHFQKPKLSNGTPSKFLRCFDVNGESVYFNLDQVGKFSPVAGEENISGVHTMKNLIRKRMPLTVKLAHGKLPSGVAKNCNNQSCPEMRLLGIVEEDCLIAMPMLKELNNVVTVPLCAGLKLQAPRNNDELRKLKEYSRVSEKCKWLGRENIDKIHVLDMSSKSKDVLQIKNSFSRYSGNGNVQQYFGNIHNHIRKLNSANDAKTSYQKRKNNTDVANSNENSVKSPNKDDGETRYDEIDIIYDYVRGFGPLPKSISKDFDKTDYPSERSKKVSQSSKTPRQSRNAQTNHTVSSVTKSPMTSSKIVPSDNSVQKLSPKVIPEVTGSPANRDQQIAKSPALPSKKPSPISTKKMVAVKEDCPPEPPPIETIPVRRSVSMPNATATNIVVGSEPLKQLPQKSSSNHKITKNSGAKDPKSPITLNMTDNVAYSNFIPLAKGNSYDKVTHEHEPFTVDLRSPNISSRGHQKKENLISKSKSTPNEKKIINNNNSVDSKSNKLFARSQSPSKHQRIRIFNHSMSSPAGDDKVSVPTPHYKRHSNSKAPKSKKISQHVTTKVNPTPSPIFNLRYKSLTDLALDFDTLGSSNSGEPISDFSGGSGPNDMVYIRSNKGSLDDGPKKKLPRPKSLTNLVWPNEDIDCISSKQKNASVKQYNNIVSNLFYGNSNRLAKKSGNGRKLSDGVLIYGRNGNSIGQIQAQRRLSALYL